MKLTISSNLLTAALRSVVRARASRSTLPVLGHVLLQADDRGLRLTCTDLEIALSTTAPAGVEEPGEVTVPADVFASIIGYFTGDVTVTADERQQVTLANGTSSYTLRGLPAGEYPAVPAVGGETYTVADAVAFRAALKRAAISTASDESRPILCGVQMEVADGTGTFASTDTHRLTVAQCQVAGPDGAFIIPERAVAELLRTTGSALGFVATPAVVRFADGDTLLTSRLIEGVFPDWRRVLPAAPAICTVDRAELLAAVRRANIVARTEASKVLLRTTGDSLQVRAATGEVGHGEEEVPATVQTPDHETAFNATYLADVLGVMACEQVAIAQAAPTHPARFDGDASAQYVVMPMQVLA